AMTAFPPRRSHEQVSDETREHHHGDAEETSGRDSANRRRLTTAEILAVAVPRTRRGKDEDAAHTQPRGKRVDDDERHEDERRDRSGASPAERQADRAHVRRAVRTKIAHRKTTERREPPVPSLLVPVTHSDSSKWVTAAPGER